MAEKRTIDINIKNNADEATKDFNTFNDALDQTAKSAKNVNSTFEEVYGELQPLTTRLGEAEDRLYELALAGDTTSKEYQELLTKVGEYRKVQIQTDLAVDGAATTLTQKLGSALNATTSGFAATQGAIALFGSENEALEESLLKVQSALAIQQGVQGLTEAYKELSIGTKLAGAAQAIFSTVVGTTSGALKVFRIALLSTGIGAIVVGLGLLIANFDKVKAAVSNAIDSFKNLGPVMKALLLPITAVVEGFELAKKGLQALGVLESDEEKARKKRAAAQQTRIEAEKKAQQEAYDERLKQIQEISKAEQVAFDRSIRLLESQGKNTIRLRKERLKQELDEAKQLLEREKRLGGFLVSLYQNLVTERQIAYNDILKEEREFYKQRRQNAEQFRKDQAEIDFGIIDEEIALLAELDKIRQENEDRFKTEQQKELDEVERKYDVLKAMAQDNAEALEEIEIARLNEKNDIELKYAEEAYNAQKALDDKAEEDRKERDAKKREDTQALNDFISNSALQTLDVVNQFAQLRADKFNALNQQILDNEELTDKQKEKMLAENNRKAKRAFEIQKAANIAQALISTYQGANAIFASAAANPATVLFPAQPFIAAGLAVAGGLANVANISRQKFEGASLGGGGDTGAPDLTGGETVAPSFNVVGDSSLNQLAQLQQQPTQAFVVSGEVTSAQALDRNRVTNATL